MESSVGHLSMVQEGNNFRYSYEGETYIDVEFPVGVGFKRGSDTDIQVEPFIQQLVFEVDDDCEFTLTLTPVDGILLRPERAKTGQAILSQVGKPLIYGVNGLYDLDSDMYVTWYGFSWVFEGHAIMRKNGRDMLQVRGCARKNSPVLILVLQQFYRKHLGYEYHDPRKRRHDTRAVCGWATWEAFRFDVTIEKLEESAAFLSKELKPYGLEYVQLDDGYQPKMMPPENSDLYSGWLGCNEKFPGGHERIVESVKKAGFTPALWLNAMINNEEYAREKCIKDKNGIPLKQPWINYVFECTEESCREIERLYSHLASLGYRYFKVDAIRHLIYDGLMVAAQEGLISNDEAIERFLNYMRAVRKGIGEENYLLSCWGMLTPNVGICDAMRFATDASASGESFRMQFDESARWHHTHGVLYLNDPDYICLRIDAAPARSLASFISLNGYLYMISDEVKHYTQEKLEIAKKTLPPTSAVTAETGPAGMSVAMNYYKTMTESRAGESALSFGNIWATHFAYLGRFWTVVNLVRTAWYAAPEKLTVPVKDLGLDPEATYVAFDFWKQRPRGFMTGKAVLDVPEYRDCTVLALTLVKEKIELIGSSRHVSMDTVSVVGMERAGSVLTLNLEGPTGSSTDYWFTAPEGTKCEGGMLEKIDGFFKCTVIFDGKPKMLKLV